VPQAPPHGIVEGRLRPRIPNVGRVDLKKEEERRRRRKRRRRRRRRRKKKKETPQKALKKASGREAEEKQ
jgi:hypothetical protein